jgi:hypothetical protein
MKYRCLMILLLICGLTACKKEPITEKKGLVYIDQKAIGSTYGGWSITLLPDFKAEIVPGGDIVYRATYKIKGSLKTKGSMLSITIDNANTSTDTFKFIIVSETELAGENILLTLTK